MVKVGNEMLRVDNANFTYNPVSGPENEAKKRLLSQTISSKQRKSEIAGMPAGSLRQKENNTSGIVLPMMKSAQSTKKMPTTNSSMLPPTLQNQRIHQSSSNFHSRHTSQKQ